MSKIGFIGAGNMATAIIKGLAKNNSSDEIYVNDIDEQKVLTLSEFGAKQISSVNELVKICDYIIFAVKPQNFPELLPQISADINKDAVIISIAAGITGEYIKKSLGYDAKIVLVMPNTPALVGKGASALAKVSPTTESEFEFAQNIFASLGQTAVIDADKMNYIIPINGSSPAFIYEIAKYFVEFATQKGIDKDSALDLFCATLEGSAKMMTEHRDIDNLINMVTSKGGTTIAGLNSMRENNLEDLIKEGCEVCAKRAFELSK